MTVHDFHVDIPDEVIDDLRDRLRRTRWTDRLVGTGWDAGTDLGYLRDVVSYWADGYDWTKAQERLNGFVHRRVEVAGGLGVHVVHESAEVVGALPVVILHGRMGSFVQVLPVLPHLTCPSANGGSKADAFDVIALSLPGCGFSDRPTEPGWDVASAAEAVLEVMSRLGHDTFVGRGSGVGASVLRRLALAHPDRVTALHLSSADPGLGQMPDDPAYAEQLASPAGLAACVLGTLRAGSDCGGDLESVCTRDDLLTDLTIRWVTGAAGSPVLLDDETAPAEDAHSVVHSTELPRGGQFLEWEVPDLLAADMRDFFRSCR